MDLKILIKFLSEIFDKEIVARSYSVFNRANKGKFYLFKKILK